ncbi:hypothetical protein [Sedimenticola sp.]|uniref:hypothetical protein n=1 Tax=Sedimenticola sp. TaxID=1940285 RepID=UPI00258900EB|nr:hypothetical protein [Sedimenticola sp.]MCW8903485.1 hypothetical protein [Sedimenticola sp.]
MPGTHGDERLDTDIPLCLAQTVVVGDVASCTKAPGGKARQRVRPDVRILTLDGGSL